MTKKWLHMTWTCENRPAGKDHEGNLIMNHFHQLIHDLMECNWSDGTPKMHAKREFDHWWRDEDTDTNTINPCLHTTGPARSQKGHKTNISSDWAWSGAFNMYLASSANLPHGALPIQTLSNCQSILPKIYEWNPWTLPWLRVKRSLARSLVQKASPYTGSIPIQSQSSSYFYPLARSWSNGT